MCNPPSAGNVKTAPTVNVSESSGLRFGLPPLEAPKPWLVDVNVLISPAGIPCSTHKAFCSCVGLLTMSQGSVAPVKPFDIGAYNSPSVGARSARLNAERNLSQSVGAHSKPNFQVVAPPKVE